MMANFLARSFWALIYSVIIGSAIYCNDTRERGENLEYNGPRFTPYISPCLLPTILIAFIVTILVMDSITGNPIDYFSFFSGCIAVFLHIGIYYIMLMPLLPAFRRRFSARTCAMLWLLPNYLYLTMLEFMAPQTPLFVIPVSLTILHAFLVIWAIGFAAVLIWHGISHLRFRRQLLRDATKVTDPTILELWQKELEYAGLEKKKYRLVRSPATQTPFSIGFFQRSIQVVLPQRYYTSEDLALILRHEIIHIGREDSGTKFFLVFCSAICWFNPLMWRAMRHSADDLELSCDETVLLEADDTTRRQYAELLLRTAGDERGFTTCLSASAQSMRYRLENVLHPCKRWSGAFAIIVVFYVLIMSCGYVAFGFNQISGKDLIFDGQDPSEFVIESVKRYDSKDWYNHSFTCTDEAALTEYLAGLNFCKVTGNYSFSDNDHDVSIRYVTPRGLEYWISLESNSLIHSGNGRDHTPYYCTDQLDWELLHSLIIPHPHLDVNMSWLGHDSHFESQISPPARILRTTTENTTTEYPFTESDYVAKSYSENPIAVCATLSFTHELYDGTFEILVENWARTSSYMVSSEDLEHPMQLDLAPYSAHYTVRATIVDDEGVIYDTEYRFDRK